MVKRNAALFCGSCGQRKRGAVLRFLWSKEMGCCFEVLVVKRNGALFCGSCGEKKWGAVLRFLW